MTDWLPQLDDNRPAYLSLADSIARDLSTGRLNPGDRWCVTAANWLRAHLDGAAAAVVLASTHERATEIVPIWVDEVLQP